MVVSFKSSFVKHSAFRCSLLSHTTEAKGSSWNRVAMKTCTAIEWHDGHCSTMTTRGEVVFQPKVYLPCLTSIAIACSSQSSKARWQNCNFRWGSQFEKRAGESISLLLLWVNMGWGRNFFPSSGWHFLMKKCHQGLLGKTCKMAASFCSVQQQAWYINL